jgi:hypothetical protein
MYFLPELSPNRAEPLLKSRLYVEVAGFVENAKISLRFCIRFTELETNVIAPHYQDNNHAIEEEL